MWGLREKTKNDGWIPISERSLGALKEYLAWRHTKGDKLFPFQYEEAWKWLKRLGERAGMGKRIHPHMFRHTAAALRRLRGQESKDLADLLGHRSVATTRRYEKLKPQALKGRIEPIF